MERIPVFFVSTLLMFLVSCSNPFNDDDSPEIQTQNGKTFIVDRTGKKWDVTHAIQNYGMKAEKFQFGLGPNAIPPILNPQFLNPGDPGYPGDNDTRLVIGFNKNGFVRSYPIDRLNSHEIVDDKFGDAHVAVAW